MKNVLAILDDNKPTLQALASINLPAGVNAEALVLQELDYLKQIAFTNHAILECIPDTIVYAVKSCLKNNLTLDPSAGLVYVKTRNVKVGNDWKKALEITPSCNGILSINYQCGKVIDHKNPEVIKDGTGKVIGVEFEYQLHNGRWEKRSFDESDFLRWRTASHKENGRNKQDADLKTLNYANAHYTSWKGGIDPEFARAKAIRHALKKLGTNVNEKYAVKIQPVVKTVDIPHEVINAEVIDSTETTDISNQPTHIVSVHEAVNIDNLDL